MIKSILLGTALAISGVSFAAEKAKEPKKEKKKIVLSVNQDRLVSILGAVNASIVEKANEVLRLADINKDPIYLFVNSPGGSVVAGNVFIDAMIIAKNRGIEVKCVTSIYAASMAFSILANCSDRYVLPNARLLFHPVSLTLFSRVTERDLSPIVAMLAAIDKNLQDFLVKSTGIDRKVMEKAYYAEKWWNAKELQKATKAGWLTIVDDIIGIKDLFSFNKRKATSADVSQDNKDEAYVIYNKKAL